MTDEIRLAQLLCSRLCHDLVGPAGAVNAGAELLVEGGVAAHEAIELLAASGRQVGRRLAFYRAAFGIGTGAGSLDEARALAAGFLAERKVDLDWPPDGHLVAVKETAAIKLVLNLLLLGVEALPRGGSLRVRLAELDDGIGVAVIAEGPSAKLNGDVRAALDAGAPLAELSPRTVQANLLARLVAASGATLEIDGLADDEVRLATLLPRSGA